MRLALVIVAAMLAAAAPASAHRLDLDFRGQAIVPTGTTFEGTTVGGLSSTTYDHRRGVYHAIADDASVINPVRYYTVALDVHDGRLTDGDVRFKDVTTMLAPDGNPYPANSLDPEGLTLTKDRELIFTSEGIRNTGIDPFVRRYSLGGRFLGSLPVPTEFLVTPDPAKGVRQNLGFESAAADGRDLFVATENALLQDGPAATVANGSRARILRYDLRKRRVERQWFYDTDRSPSRRCRPPSSRSTGSWSCCRSTTIACSRWSARSRSARRGPATRSSSSRCRCTGRRPARSYCWTSTSSGSRSTTSRA